MTTPNENGVIERPQIVLELPRTEPPTWQGGPWARICIHPSDLGHFWWTAGYDFKLQGASWPMNIKNSSLEPTAAKALTAAKTFLADEIAKIKGSDAKYARKVREWMKNLSLPDEINQIPEIPPNETPEKGIIPMAKTPKKTKQFIKVTVTGFIPAPNDLMDMAGYKAMHDRVKQLKTLVSDNMQDVKFDARPVGRLVEIAPDAPKVKDTVDVDPLTVTAETAGEIAENESEDIDDINGEPTVAGDDENGGM